MNKTINKNVSTMLLEMSDFFRRVQEAYERGMTANEIAAFEAEFAILSARKGALATELGFG